MAQEALQLALSTAPQVSPALVYNRVPAVAEAQPQRQQQEMVATVGRPEVVAVEVAQLWLLAPTGVAMAALAGAEKSGLFHMLLIRGHNAN